LEELKVYTRLSIAILTVAAIFTQTGTDVWKTRGAPAKSGSVITNEQSERTAVLTVINGFANQPGNVNPLLGKTLVLFKESFEGFLKRTGMFAGPPGSTSKVNPQCRFVSRRYWKCGLLLPPRQKWTQVAR
jgi:hypothetical protein